jgi:hypothetical protein
MLLSESESFWMAILCDNVDPLLRRVPRGVVPSAPITVNPDESHDGNQEAVVDGLATSKGVLNEGQIADDHDGEAAASEAAELQRGLGVYQKILDIAVSYGIARRPELRAFDEVLPAIPPADTVWGFTSKGKLSPDECEELQQAIQLKWAAVHERLTSHADGERLSSTFDRFFERVISKVIVGHALSQPGLIYRISNDGQPCLFGLISARSRGLYLTVISLLSELLPLPADERMAVVAASRRDDVSLRDWVPSISGLHAPLGSFDRVSVSNVLGEFRRSNESSKGWMLAERLCELLRMAQEVSEGCAIAAAHLEQFHDEEGEDGQADGSGADDEESGIESVAGSTPGLTDRWQGFGDAAVAFVEEVCVAFEELAPSLLDSKPAKDDEAEYLQDVFLENFRDEADDLADLCREWDLANVAEMILAARDAAPEISSNHPLYSAIHPTTVSKYDTLAERFDNAISLLHDAMRVAYGELRLRELKWGDHALPAPALTGWAGQKDNIREAIRVAIDQLNNGLKPYVVLTQLAPAVQSLICELSSRHLDNFAGLNAAGLLKALKDKLRATNDEELRVAVRVADALNTLRNRVVHEDSIDWDRDHAAFFLNGISILLRSV